MITKSKTDKFWHYQDIIYNFKAQLHGTESRSEVTYEEPQQVIKAFR